MHSSGFHAVAPRPFATRSTSIIGALALAVTFAFIALTLLPAKANAAFTITDWALTPSTTQAGGHPNVTFRLNPDASAGDQTGDDLKSVKVEFSAGMLANPASIPSPCTSSQFASDKCPAATKLGTLSVKYRKGRSYFTMPGTAYELVSDANSVMTVGFIVRPSGYQKIFLKSTKVGGVATVRTGVDADYGIDMTFDSIPRTLKTTWGSTTNVTIADITVNIQSRSNTNASPSPYFTFNPTRCGSASTRATMTSYLGVVAQRTTSFTTTGCSSVPFTPTFTAAPTNNVAGAPTGISATVTVPTADATIQQSHVQNVTTTLPTGTSLNSPAINAVGALCTDAQLNADTCPLASEIGTTSVNVPFLPPTMTGKIYLMGRGSSITFGYTLHGSGNTLVSLKGSATAVDLGSDGIPDAVRAYLINLPQAPFSSATMNFSAQLVNNSATGCGTNGQTITAAIAGYSGASVTKTSSHTLTGCTTTPETTINSGPASPAADNTPTFTFSSTTAGATFECSLDAAAFAACTSPLTTAVLADGSHTFQVRAVGTGGTDPSPASQTFIVDTTAPTVTVVSPTEGQTISTSSVSSTFTATDTNGVASVTCKLDAAAAAACTSPKTYTGLANGAHTIVVTATDNAGNAASQTRNFTVSIISIPVVTISSPVNGAILNATSASVAFAATNSPTSVTCKLDAAAAAACTSPVAYSGLTQGTHTVVVAATNAAGTGSASVGFTVDTIAPVVSISSPANGSTTGSSVSLAFTATDATTSITGRTCKLDAAAAVACTSPLAYSGLATGSHTIVVTATDQAGNTGSATTTFTVAALPVITITSPANGAFLNTTSTSVAWSATNSPTSTTCKLDAAAATACSSPQAYSGLSQGAHTVVVAVTNAAGTGTMTVNFTVDSIVPAVAISSPANGSTTGASVTATFTVTDATTTTTTCKLDATAATACSSGQAYSGLAAGSHTIVVTATDQATNTGSASTTFTVATTPSVTISSPVNGAILNTTSTSVVFSATNSPTGYTCKLDAAAAAACTSPKSYSGLGQGGHAVVVTATNAAGSGSATVNFTVDSIAPAVSISSPANGSTTGGSVTTVFTATDATTSVTGTTCKLDAAAATACASGQAYSGLAAGSHTIVVTATDQASNTGSASTTFTVAAIPVITITVPPDGAYINTTTVSVGWTATNSPTSTTCKLDAAAAVACTSPQAYSGLSQGLHTVTIAATNAAGTGSSSITFTVDSIAPAVAISAPANGSTTGNAVTATFAVTDATATTTTCKLDAAAATSCSSGQAYSGLSAGSHTILVTATDQAANTGSASTTFTVAAIPVVTISAPVNGAFINTTGTSVVWTATNSPTGTTCKLDAAAATACTSPQAYSGLSQGAHTVVVTATNLAGSGTGTVNFTVDSIAPVVAISIPANGSTTGNSVNLTFTATDATTSITGRTCKLDAAAATACTSPLTYSGLTAGSHTILVTATDQASNTGSASTTFTVAAIPVVTISAPANGAFINTTGTSVAWTATNSPTSTTCKLDAAAAAACTSPQAYSGLSQGAHTVVVAATNAAGTGSATVNFTVDSIAPVVAISAPANGSTTGTSVAANFTVTDATTTTTTCKLDALAATACTSGQVYSSLSTGSHTIVVTATDQATNTGSATTTFTVAPIPSVVISSPANGAFLNSTSTSIVFTTTGSPTSITCKLDAAAAAACTSPQAYGGLSQGAHTVVVTATNASGSGTGTVAFTVDSIAPVVAISSPANGSTTGTSVTTSFTVTDATTTTTTCKLDAAAAAACTTGQVYSGLAAGSHTIVVAATDQASNTGSASTTFTVASLPVVTISAPVNGAFINSTGTSVVWTSTGSPTGTTCKLDAAAAAACTSPQAYSGLSQGAHTVVVAATNAAGTGSATVNFTVDSIAPVVAISIPANGSTTGNSVNLTFTATDATTSITGRTCKLDAAAATACTSPLTYSGLSAGSHTILVTATDQASNTGSASTTFTVASLPVVTISAPANGAFINTTGTSVAWTATGSPTGTTCKLDAAAAAACTSPQAYSGLSQGAHTVVVAATNAAGTGSATVNFTVDSIAPVVAISSPANGSTTGTSVTTSFTVTDATTTTTTCKLDAAAAAACTTGQVYSGLAAGSHTIVVAATDQAANPGSASTTFTVASIPVVTISAPVNGAFINTTGTSVAWTATNSPTGTTCKLDAAAATACTSPQAYSGLSQGAHTVVVTATNLAGSGTGTVNFTVDSIAPAVAISSPANGSTTGTSVTTSFTVTDATTTTTTCKLDAAAAAACTTGQVYSGLAAGSHTIVVAATDQAANPGSASTTFTVASIPVVTISAPVNGAFINTTGTSVAWTATNSPTSTTCKLDAAAAAACTSPQAYSGLSQGAHTVVVAATNAAGTGSATVNFTVDSIAPVVAISIPANGSTTGNSVNLTFTATDATTSITGRTCKLDAAAATACTSPLTYSALSTGSHTILVTATDQAANTGSASTTFTVTGPPVVTISSPANGAFVNSTTVSVAWTATNSPTGTTCKLDAAAAAACTSPQAYSGLSQGAHTVVVTATNVAGSGAATVNFTVDSIAPAVAISSPANGSTTGTSVTTSFTVTDATTTTTTCKLDAAAATSCTTGQVYSGLSAGSHTILVTATDQATNTGSASTTFTVGGTPPDTTITVKPGPATSSTTPSFSFTGTNSPTGYSCQIDATAPVACNSGSFTAPALSDVTIHKFSVAASNAGGTDLTPAETYFQVDTRAFGVSATLTKEPNSLTTLANVSAPAQHPDVSSTITLQGAADTKSAVLQLPHGLNGSLASVPEVDRCSIAEATSGTCPASSLIGTGSGQIVVTDSGTQLTVTGEGYLTDPPTSADAAGIAIKGIVPGGRGAIIANGGVQLINNGTTVQGTVDNLPTTTVDDPATGPVEGGVPFHATSISVTVNGDTGGSANPLITNPSFCGAPSTATTGTGMWVPFRPTGDVSGANLTGYKGPFVNIVGTATSYASTTASTSVPYTITGCSNTVPPYAPTLTQTLYTPAAGSNTAVSALLISPANNSTTHKILVKEPPKLGANFGSFGASTDQCPSGSAISTGAAGIGNAPFDKSSCPPQARIGQMKIITPLLATPVIGDIYLINKSPLPWLGIHVDPTVTYPGRPVGETNPQGVTLDLLGTTATPTVHSTCSSGNGDPNCGIGQSSCDLDTQFCQTQITVNVSMLPDIPLSSAIMYLGRLADGTTAPPGRIGTGSIVSNDPVAVISSGDNTCSTGIDPNTAGADTGGGSPFTSNVVNTFTAWSRVSATGGLISGGTLLNTSQTITTPGC